MSLKLKINLIAAILLLVSLLASSALLISNARQSVQDEVESTMTSAARIITVVIAGNHLSRNMPINDQMHAIVQALSEIRNLHILLFDSTGLLFEGEPQDAGRIEAPGWFVKLLLPDVKPLANRFGSGHMVIYADPMQEINESWQDIRGLLALSLGFFILVGLFLYWGLGRLLHPLEKLLVALAGFEKGDLHLRLPHFSLKEMDRIGQGFNRMGQTLEKSTEENKRLAMLVRQSGDAILSLDQQGNITFYNPSAEKMFAFATENLLGKSLASLGFSINQQQIADVLKQCATVENLETALEVDDDSSLTLLFSTVPLMDNEQSIIGMICSLRDITEHKQIETAENQLYETRLLAQHMSEVQENERRHLARELHDELGQCLTAIKTDAVLIRNRSKETEPKIFTSAQAIIDIASHIYDVVHNMITRLRPSPLDDLGLLATLEQSISAWRQRQADIHFSLEIQGEVDNLDEAYNMTVYRVVQEAITNAVRHAEATEIVVSVIRQHNKSGEGSHIYLDIRDNGKGMIVQDLHSDVDFGLLGMRERAHSMGGVFELDSSLGKGLAIHIELPIGA